MVCLDAQGNEAPGETGSDSKPPPPPVNGDGSDLYQEVWKKKNEEAIEEEFQKELRVVGLVT